MPVLLSILTLIEAGAVKENDDTLGIMQGVDEEHAQGIADWLALAVQGPVKLELLQLTDKGAVRTVIRRSGPLDVKVSSWGTPHDPSTNDS